MLNLLKSVYNLFSKGLSTVYHWVLNAIAAVYSYVIRLYDALGKEIVSVYDSLESFARSVDQWVTRTVDNIIHDIESTARSIEQWFIGLYDDLRNYAVSVYQWAVRTFDSIIKSVEAAIAAIERWVIQNIWNPLLAFIRSVDNWVTKYGLWLYDMVSNPDKLVAWLARYLLSAWLKILRTWAVPVSRFIMQQWRNLEPDFISILEDILSKVL